VEEDKQLAWLRGQYCDAVQGYIFSKPLDKQVATNWLKTHYACC
jgi:EAL domain-containing protein (putative c-di-GMP-specific phosphodiesterase class I)